MASESSGRRGLTWAVIGGLVLVAGIVAIIAGSLLAQDAPTPTGPTGGAPIQPSSPETPPEGEVVDPTVTDLGWRSEPITTDIETYIRAALEAASTFDTTKAKREAWLDHLDTWFTPDTRFISEADQQAAMADSGLLQLCLTRVVRPRVRRL